MSTAHQRVLTRAGYAASMPRAILHLLPLLLLASVLPAQARTMTAKIERVTTAVATLEGVEVRLDWPAQATTGELRLRAARVDAPDLGYRFRSLEWRCPLARDGQGGWRCDGELRSEEHTSELQSLMRISYAVFCLKKKNKSPTQQNT